MKWSVWCKYKYTQFYILHCGFTYNINYINAYFRVIFIEIMFIRMDRKFIKMFTFI